LFAYGLANARAIPEPHHLLLVKIHNGFIFLTLIYPSCPGKEAFKPSAQLTSNVKKSVLQGGVACGNYLQCNR